MAVPVVAGCDAVIDATLVDGNTGTALDLTGATVTCKVLGPQAVHITPSATVSDAATGTVTCTVAGTDTATVGTYSVQFFVAWADGTESGSQQFTFTVQAPVF